MDTAALYCCSAEKKKNDKILQEFHDNVDLLSLLNLADPVDDIFAQATQQQKILQRQKSSHKNIDGQLPIHVGSQGPDMQKIKTLNTDAKISIDIVNEPSSGTKSETVVPKPIDIDESSRDSSFFLEQIKSKGSLKVPEKTEDDDDDNIDECKPEDREYEEALSAQGADLNEEYYTGDSDKNLLFTCPARPFISRMSFLGELFPEEPIPNV